MPGSLFNFRKGHLVKPIIYSFICRLLIVCTAALPCSVQAGMVATQELVAASVTQGNRDKVRDFVSRSDVQRQLESLGLDPANAKERVNALTDQEIQQLAGKIDRLPAGADDGLVAVVAIVAIVLLVMFYWKK